MSVSAPPTGLDECLFIFFSLVSDPLALRFSVSSGCAKRRSVSTYAAILVLSSYLFFLSLFSCQNLSIVLSFQKLPARDFICVEVIVVGGISWIGCFALCSASLLFIFLH